MTYKIKKQKKIEREYKENIKLPFITNPYETYNGKYSASFGKDLNKNVKYFKTLKEAKNYIKQNGYEKALYDSPTEPKVIKV